MCGEGFAVTDQFFVAELDSEQPRLTAGIQQLFAPGGDDHAVAAVGDIIAIFSDPVQAGHVAEVLYGPGGQQFLPVQTPLLRPVGDVEQQVEVTVVAAPDREA